MATRARNRISIATGLGTREAVHVGSGHESYPRLIVGVALYKIRPCGRVVVAVGANAPRVARKVWRLSWDALFAGAKAVRAVGDAGVAAILQPMPEWP